MRTKFEFIVIVDRSGWKYEIELPEAFVYSLDVPDCADLDKVVGQSWYQWASMPGCRITLIEMYSELPGGYVGSKRLSERPDWFPSEVSCGY